MTTESDTSAPVPAQKPKPAKISAGAVFAALGLLLIELILPVLIAGGLIWYLFYAYNLWGLEHTLSLVLFGTAVVIVALVLSVLGDSLLAGFRNSFARQGARFNNSTSLRMIKMALGGFILPVAAILVANLVAIPAGGTTMNLLITLAQKPVSNTPPGEVGKITTAAKNPATKMLGISVLQGLKSADSLTVLIQIATDDKTTLANPATNAALAKAIGSYGLLAKPGLLKLFAGIDPARLSKAPGINSGLYDRYFTGAFESLQADTVIENTDPAVREARLAQVQAAQAQLKSALANLDASAASADGSDPRLDFVLQSFMAMDITTDKDILTFAKTTADDTRFSSQVRGDALLLIAKFGDKTDLDGLFLYLKGGDDLLQARALKAIASLQDKLNHTVGK